MNALKNIYDTFPEGKTVKMELKRLIIPDIDIGMIGCHQTRHISDAYLTTP